MRMTIVVSVLSIKDNELVTNFTKLLLAKKTIELKGVCYATTKLA